MPTLILALALAGQLPSVEPPEMPFIEGVVVNGSKSASPVAGAKVVLLAGKDEQFERMADTTTDRNGRFIFDDRRLPLAPDVVYIPGAQWDGVYYPGPRLHRNSGGAPARVQLAVHDAVTSPCPLVAEMHEIDIEINTGFLNVTEILVVRNPTLSTYVGSAGGRLDITSPTTLSLSIPDGVSHVTFNKEYDGRNFQLVDGRMVTNVPWPPGERKLAFRYQLPVENNQFLFKRPLDLPCLTARVAVVGQVSQELSCNIPRITGASVAPIGFESWGKTLPAGYVIQLQMGQLSVNWIVYARGGAIILLGGLLVATTMRLKLRRRPGVQQLARKGASSGRRSVKT